ncbi:hypothetical protein E2320_008306, partial [Naja naja]
VGELLKDWRRLNVAITRAKHKVALKVAPGCARDPIFRAPAPAPCNAASVLGTMPSRSSGRERRSDPG